MQKKALFIAESAVIAALYTAATYAFSAISFGPVQFRLSEALTILPVFTPAAVPGLAIGCFFSNLGSPFGLLDVALGSLATLLSAIVSRKLRRVQIKSIPILSVLSPVVFNAFIVSAAITLFTPDEVSLNFYLLSALSVGVGELVVCCAAGIPLFFLIKKTGVFERLRGLQ